MTDALGQPIADDVYDNFVISLYRNAREATVGTFQERCFVELQALVPFESGFWSRASIEDDLVRLAGNWRFHLPEVLESIWAPLQDRDMVGKLAFATPGRTINVVARDLIGDPELVERIIAPFGLEHVLSTCLIDAQTGLFNSITIFRGLAGPPFSEAERHLVERVTPHLVEAFGDNRLFHLMETRQPSGRLDYATAACDRDGLLYVASPKFASVLQLEWPDWRGPRLPDAAAALIRDGGRAIYRGGDILILCEPVNELLWLRARRKEPADDLSARELEVARLSASGRTNKEIARDLGISPFTVRNQLAAIYERLGITGRAELAALLARLE